MAKRRMFSLDVVDTDIFLEMPSTARLLYYDLGIRADDEGFITPQKVIRTTGATTDDLKVLVGKQFVHIFEDGVIVILDWVEMNNIAPSKITISPYHNRIKTVQKIRKQLQKRYEIHVEKVNKKYLPEQEKHAGIMQAKVSVGKDRIGNTTQHTPAKAVVAGIPKNEVYLYWEQEVAPITTGIETQRKASVTLLNKYGPEACQKMVRVVAHAHGDRYANKEVKSPSLNSLLANWDRVVIYAKGVVAKRQNASARVGFVS